MGIVSGFNVPHSVLVQHVFHSNWIEGYEPINYPETSRLFKNHLAAAQEVVRNGTWDPQELHLRLLNGTGMLPPEEIGIFRRQQVYVGRFTPPSPGAHLLRHVQRWKELVVAGPDRAPEEWCWRVHDEYECVHPFSDGNGRTGRLILNAMRLSLGLPWLIVHHGDEQQRYYRHIDDYQHSGEWKCSQWRQPPEKATSTPDTSGR